MSLSFIILIQLFFFHFLSLSLFMYLSSISPNFFHSQREKPQMSWLIETRNDPLFKHIWSHHPLVDIQKSMSLILCPVGCLSMSCWLSILSILSVISVNCPFFDSLKMCHTNMYAFDEGKRERERERRKRSVSFFPHSNLISLPMRERERVSPRDKSGVRKWTWKWWNKIETHYYCTNVDETDDQVRILSVPVPSPSAKESIGERRERV